MHPRVVAALALQMEARRFVLAAGARHVGWKVGRDFPEVEAVIGDAPVLGHLTTATRLQPGETYAGARTERLRAETELALRLGPDGEVAAVATALEIVDVTRPPSDLQGIVAGNAFHRAFALGRAGAAMPVRAEARTVVDGEVRAVAPVDVDVAGTVRSVADLLAAVGEKLEPGDVILSGASTHVPVAHGERAVAEIEGLGAVDLALSPA